MRHSHELRTLTESDPQGLALGLVQAWTDGNQVLLRRLVVGPIGDADLCRGALLFLVDLAVPHQCDFEGPTREHAVVAGLVLARATGLDDTFEELLGSADPVRLLVLAVALVSQLRRTGRLELPTVRFASWVDS